MTALMDAALHGHADCVRLLIDAGANKDAQSMVCFDIYVADDFSQAL
jgi:hypothetical protein